MTKILSEGSIKGRESASGERGYILGDMGKEEREKDERGGVTKLKRGQEREGDMGNIAKAGWEWECCDRPSMYGESLVGSIGAGPPACLQRRACPGTLALV